MTDNQDITEAYNREFCDFLEYHLCNTLRQSERKAISRLWCDGIVWEHYSKEDLSVKGVAWIGEDGQGEYEMTIKFGEQALSLIATGTDLRDCVPSAEQMDWIKIDTESRRIELQLK